LTFVAAAIDVLGLRAVRSMVDRIVDYLPNLIAAALIILVALLLARLVRGVTRSGVAMAGLPQSEQIGSLAHGGVVLIGSLIALERLGVEITILVNVLTALVATLGLSTGLALALGARPLITHILAGHVLRRSLVSGSSVEINGRRGVVERVGALETTFHDGTTSWTVPNAILLETVIIR
jgi:hypothetical protein